MSLVAALAASWVVAGQALRPLDTMTETVEAIGSAQDLRRRLPEATVRDEVGRLTEAFNGMMGRLDDAYRRLEEALDSQRQFVADASHELRTPLTSIRANLGLLMSRSDISAADRAEALQDMDAESRRMSRLAADLLTLARADAGQRLEMAPVDLPRLGDEVVRRARRAYPGRHFGFSRERALRVWGNADSLRQLLWILLDNAARHTDGGARAHVTIDAGPGTVRLVVTDDGRGIPPADQERVFERFYRADPARSTGGAGLGLSIARWIVEQHGGRISVANSGHSGGAAFTVELPAAPAEKRRNVTRAGNS
ncbi:MAG: sensor histidine kinase [Candidatus Dormibacteria bacterium]